MSFYNENIYKIQFFKFSCLNVDGDNSTWIIPATVTEGTDAITISSEWTKQNVQGGTESMSAFSCVNNPVLNIDLKFSADMWREYTLDHTYSATIAKLASLQYPGGTTTLNAPYVTISWCGQVYRGYFTNMKIVTSGPLRTLSEGVYIRPFCSVTGNFTVSKTTSPYRSNIQNNYSSAFGDPTRINY